MNMDLLDRMPAVLLQAYVSLRKADFQYPLIKALQGIFGIAE